IIAVCRARGRDHARADMLGKLNGEAGNPARSTLNENRLAALKLQRVFDGAERGEAGQRHGGGVDVREALRLFRDDRSLDRDLLPITAFWARLATPEHRLPNGEIRDAGTDGGDRAGKIPSQDQWELRRFVLTGAHLPIRGIDAGGMDV